VTCYLRLHEVAVAVHRDVEGTDWDAALGRWREAAGVDGRDTALASMPVTVIDLDDLPGADLDPFAGLILSGRADQRMLTMMGEVLRTFLDDGAVVAFSGQLTGDWLPGATPFERTTPDGEADDRRPPRLASDALFAGVSPSDLGPTFLYRDGWHRPHDGAEVVARRADGTPGAYVNQISTRGTILLHGGANLLATGTADTSAARIVPQLVAWVAGQARR
jgi:hypothetical protein